MRYFLNPPDERHGINLMILLCNCLFFGIIINMASDLGRADMMEEPLYRWKGEDLRCT